MNECNMDKFMVPLVYHNFLQSYNKDKVMASVACNIPPKPV